MMTRIKPFRLFATLSLVLLLNSCSLSPAPSVATAPPSSAKDAVRTSSAGDSKGVAAKSAAPTKSCKPAYSTLRPRGPLRRRGWWR